MFRPLYSLMLILLLAIGGLAQSSVSSQDSEINSAVEPNAIRLVLETSKAIYLEGEPVVITAYLENRGSRPYYVGNTLAGLFGRVSNHYMNLKIFDAKGKEVAIGQGGGGN